jgi:hypothetical protein
MIQDEQTLSKETGCNVGCSNWLKHQCYQIGSYTRLFLQLSYIQQHKVMEPMHVCSRCRAMTTEGPVSILGLSTINVAVRELRKFAH